MKRAWAVLAVVVVTFLAIPRAWASPAASNGPHVGASEAGPTSVKATSPPSSIGVRRGPVGLSLLGQSSFVRKGGSFDLRLAVSSPDPSVDRIQVLAYPRLTTRTAFLAAQSGHLPPYSIWGSAALPITSFPRAPAGGIQLKIPVDKTAPHRTIPTFNTSAGQPEGIYPFQVALYNANGVPLGPRLTTFLVYTGTTSDFPKLSVALILPFAANPVITRKGGVGELSSAASKRLAATAKTLLHEGVTVSLKVSPATLDSLRSGPRSDRSTLATLARAVRTSHDEVLPASYVPVTLAGMARAGLGGEIARQFAQGASTIKSRLGVAPSRHTWAVDGRLGRRSLEALRAAGMTRLVIPNNSLTPLRARYRNTTFAKPTRLFGAPAEVVGADDTLAGHFVAGGNQVLAAERLLADLSMVQMETPSVRRGVAVMPPRGSNVGSAFLTTLLAGLRANPILSPVSERRLFSTVPEGLSSDGSPLVRGLARPQGSAGARLGRHLVSALKTARLETQAIAAIAPERGALLSRLRRTVLLAEWQRLRSGAALSVLSSVRAALKGIRAGLALPASASITLTSRDGRLPLTLLASNPLGDHVELRLHSAKLVFLPFQAAGGACSRPGPSTEICRLDLSTARTTLQVPVEARTSGVFGLEEQLFSPNGTVLLSARRDVVRSTAVSDVGIALIVIATASLAAWWVRDLRHGRRAARLMPPEGLELNVEELEADHGFEPAKSSDGPERPQPPDRLPAAAHARAHVTIRGRRRSDYLAGR